MACALTPTNLTVEYTPHHAIVDIAQPRFSWKLEAVGSARDCVQSRYELKVARPSLTEGGHP